MTPGYSSGLQMCLLHSGESGAGLERKATAPTRHRGAQMHGVTGTQVCSVKFVYSQICEGHGKTGKAWCKLEEIFPRWGLPLGGLSPRNVD